MAATRAERSALASAAASMRWARERDRRAATQAARDAFDQRFYDEVDPDCQLPADERRVRALAARRAYFARIRAKALKAERLCDEAERELRDVELLVAEARQ